MRPLSDYGVRPVSRAEAGRGRQLPRERTDALERFCAEAMRDGYKQYEIKRYLQVGASRASRWCISGLKKYGCQNDHRLLNRSDKTLTQMLWARTDVRGADDCWPWLGFIKNSGYGSLNFKGTAGQAHRLMYEALVGVVPAGLVIDHKCENKSCVNPRHLQPVTPSLNLMLRAVRRD